MTPFSSAAVQAAWSGAEKCRQDIASFLEPDNLKAEYARIASPCNIEKEIMALGRHIAADPGLFDLFTFMHYDLFIAAANSVDYWGFPEMEYPGCDKGIFHLLLAISSLAPTRATHRKLGIPERYSDASATWIGGTIPIYQAGHGGRPGHDIRQTLWLRNNVEGRLFRIGRFEFKLEDQVPDFLPEIFRRKSDGAVLALARPGWEFDAGGFIHGHGNSGPACFKAARHEDEETVSGVPLSPLGHAVSGEISLKKSDWRRIDSGKAGKISLHIPGGGGMTPEVAAFSLAKALRFFPKYLHIDVGIILCRSWILDPVLEEKLPHSNIAELQRQLYLLPVENDGCGDLFFAFGRHDNTNWREFTATNTIQKTLLDVLRSGRPFRNGGMFMLPEEVSAFGSAPYRRNFPLNAKNQGS